MAHDDLGSSLSEVQILQPPLEKNSKLGVKSEYESERERKNRDARNLEGNSEAETLDNIVDADEDQQVDTSMASGDYGEDIDTDTDVYEDKDVGKSIDELRKAFSFVLKNCLYPLGRAELAKTIASLPLSHAATMLHSHLNSHMNFDINIENYTKEAQEARILSPAQLLGGFAIKTPRHYGFEPVLRIKGGVLPEIFDQGSCKACSSLFAAKSKSPPMRLSIQHIVDYLPIAKQYVGNKNPADPRGCYYNTLGNSFEFIRDCGVCFESDYPYKGKRRNKPTYVDDFFIKDFFRLDTEDKEAMNKKLEEQLIAGAIKIYQSLLRYQGEWRKEAYIVLGMARHDFGSSSEGQIRWPLLEKNSILGEKSGSESRGERKNHDAQKLEGNSVAETLDIDVDADEDEQSDASMASGDYGEDADTEDSEDKEDDNDEDCERAKAEEEELYRDVPVEKLPMEIRVERLKDMIGDDPESFLSPGEVEVDYEKWIRYFDQLHKSENFDINIKDYPEDAEEARVVPLLEFRSNNDYPQICGFARDALNCYNKKEGKNYAFKDILTVNVTVVSGVIYYITFKASAGDAGDSGDAGDFGEIFQAEIYAPIREPAVVNLCRRKPVK